MSVEFENALAAVEQARSQADPVRIAKEELASTRARAVAALEEFRQAVATRHRPFFEGVATKLNRAAQVGVSHPNLHHTVREAFSSMTGGLNGMASIVHEIDDLNAYAVDQRWHATIPGRLEMYRAHFGYLEALAKRAEFELRELEESVKREARVVPPLTGMVRRDG
jgi:hypothetical protein